MARSSATVSAKRLDACLERAAARFAARRESAIPMLQAVQADLGFLPPAALKGIAAHVGMPEATVQGIATFYAQFRFEPPGRHRVTVCRGTACHVRGSAKLLDEMRASLAVQPGSTTADGAFTLETVACFGSCALAPVMVVDGKVYGRQTPAAARKTTDRIRRGDRPSRPGRRP